MMLEANQLSIQYKTLRGTVTATNNVTFSVNEGEILGIAGESGCGKSTLCNSLILLKPPMHYKQGTVTLKNQELPLYNNSKMKAFRYKDISIIPQYAMDALNPIRKIGTTIKEILTCHNKKYLDNLSLIHDRLTLVNLSVDILTMYPFELSGGMKQRLVMVIATLLNPSVLICDEITSALDVTSQRAVVELTRTFVKNDIVKCVLFVTHDISVLYQVADTIMIMYAGSIVEKASTETIIHSPKHPYTQMLMSSLPEIGVQYAEKKLKSIPGKPPSLFSIPRGCSFKDRCPQAKERCLNKPVQEEIETDHFISCWEKGVIQ